MFTVATAITRLTSGPTNIFGDGTLTSGQQLQRINEVLEYFYENGTWRGVQRLIVPASVGGVITLDTAYQRLDGLSVPLSCPPQVFIKSMSWAFSVNGPGVQDWTQYPKLLAIDMGDNSSGQRQYQLTGNPAQLGTFVFSGLARKRFSWITDTSTVIVPDSYQALMEGILAFRAKDNQDKDSFKTLMSEAMSLLNGNLQEFGPEDNSVQVQPGFGMGSFPLIN